MSDAEAIRAAIEAIADEAYPPQRIRFALDARSRHHRQRRLLLRVAGATATAAVAGAGGVAAYRLTRPEGTVFPEIPGGPGGGWLQAAPRWRPAWLPDGFGLTSLGAVVDGDTAVSAQRVWSRPQRAGERSASFVAFAAGWSDTYAPSVAPVRRVDINGVPGDVTEFADHGGVLLTWQPAGEPKLSVSIGLGNGEDVELERNVALRVARSLRRDRSTFAIGPRPGWLPAEFAAQPWMYSLKGEGAFWRQQTAFRTASSELGVSATSDGARPVDTGTAQTIRIRGAQAWLDPQGTLLFVEQLDDRNVLVSGSAAEGADLRRVAEDFDLGPIPDMTWYGKR